MPTFNADKTIKHIPISGRKQLKRLFVIMSTAPVPEPKTPAVSKPEKPSYLRYIEYA